MCVICRYVSFFFVKQKAAYEMRISDWSSDVCSSDLLTVNVPSSGRIANGATIERAVDTGFAQGDHLLFNLHQFDATNAKRVADAINRALGPSAATKVDGASISIRSGGSGADRMRSEERSVGKKCDRTWRSGWQPVELKKEKKVTSKELK